MATRTWLAVILCCLVWFGWLEFFAPKPVPRQNVTSSAPAPGTTTGDGKSEGKVENPGPVREATASTPLFKNVPSSAITETKNAGPLQVGLSDAGGRISEIRLPAYHETTKKDSPLIAVVDPAISSFSLATLFSDASLSEFAIEKYQREASGDVVRYSRTSREGVKVVKEYKLPSQSEDHLIVTTLHFTFPAGAKRDWGYVAIPVGARSLQFDTHSPLKSWEAVVLQNDSVTRKTSEDLEKMERGETLLQGANTAWLAFGNRYFSTALINAAGMNPDAVLYSDKNFSGGYLRYPLVLKEGQTSFDLSFKVYAGPKEYTELSQIPGMKQLIDYGKFAFLAYPLLELLRFFHKFVHNYGVAIILLTIVVRLLFYPLSLKSYRSMKSMQKLQPQIQALKEKYKDDKEKFNREQIALFKAHKVNPAGGCVPMLIQLPVFLALYSVLQNSIELFQAPFFGWIHDLSTRDPFYIFPVLMGAAMFVQQKITPAAGMDPAQQKMMLLMPVVFTFFMVNLPSGLTIYMFTSTLLGILQQYSMTRESSTNSAAKLVTTSSSAPEKG